MKNDFSIKTFVYTITDPSSGMSETDYITELDDLVNKFLKSKDISYEDVLDFKISNMSEHTCVDGSHSSIRLKGKMVLVYTLMYKTNKSQDIL